ncbi:hypothetical protein [Undibacterium sp. Di24W]|uniref:hypothetical protein n=1 Tax=Undibacterium sp. Di24W TaxID=3413033 RepID=UPI003BF387CA
MSENQQALAIYDDRPFFETALRHGMRKAIITQAKLAMIEAEAPKGLVQIAEAFGSKYLRPEIETACKRIVNLASLYLLETSQGDLNIAAKLIRDNTFLTLSRGGSGLLKSLFALPEYALLGREQKARIEDFLDVWSLKDKPQEYRNLLAHRQQNALEIEAGFWFGRAMDITQTELQEEDAEALAVIRTAILKRLIGDAEAPIENQIEFAQIIEALRKEGKSKTKKPKIFEVQQAQEQVFAEPIPEKFVELSRQVLDEILTRDIPMILEPKNSLDRLVFELKERYFICAHELEDTSDYDALVSKEWAKLTKGKTDIDSLLTLFLCIAVDVPAKTSLPEKTAKSIVKKIREHGLDAQKAIAWIKSTAPHEKQEGLLQDWADFTEEAPTYLLDDWDTNYSGAMRFLSENCHIEKAVKRSGIK